MTKKYIQVFDASIEIGAGHFVRQLAFAQLLIDERFDVHFLTKTTQKRIDKSSH